jgi:hypothetical protein
VIAQPILDVDKRVLQPIAWSDDQHFRRLRPFGHAQRIGIHRMTRGFSEVPSYLTVPVIVLSPGAVSGAAGAAVGSGVAAGAELVAGSAKPHAAAMSSANKAIPARTRINMDLSPASREYAMNLQRHSCMIAHGFSW